MCVLVCAISMPECHMENMICEDRCRKKHRYEKEGKQKTNAFSELVAWICGCF